MRTGKEQAKHDVEEAHRHLEGAYEQLLVDEWAQALACLDEAATHIEEARAYVTEKVGALEVNSR